MKTVKEVSEIAGVSIRTLRYYDEIGLLKPTKYSDAGYRLYDKKALERLQLILFFREVETPLPEIHRILDDPNSDRAQVLQMQKTLLEQKRNRLSGLIELLSDVMKGVDTMSFEAFNADDVTKILENLRQNLSPEEFDELKKACGGGSYEGLHAYFPNNLEKDRTGAKLLQWYGGKEQAMRAACGPRQDMSRYQKKIDAVCKQLATLAKTDDTAEASAQIAVLAQCYKKMFGLDNARMALLDMASQYMQNLKVRKAHDAAYGDGSAAFTARAIRLYYGAEAD